MDLRAIREKLDRAKATGAFIGVDHETTLALLEHIEELEQRASTTFGRLRVAQERVRELEEALRSCDAWFRNTGGNGVLHGVVQRALSPERMPSDG